MMGRMNFGEFLRNCGETQKSFRKLNEMEKNDLFNIYTETKKGTAWDILVWMKKGEL